MGHPARRRRKSQPLSFNDVLRRVTKCTLFTRESRQEDDTMPNTSPALQFFKRIWHLPESVRWMDPLPPFHRRAIIVAVLVVLLAFLWPSPAPQQQTQRQPDKPLANNAPPMQAEIVGEQPGKAAPAATPDSQGAWRDYQVASGQTLAQLFRDNGLPVNDVFAMAQVEGNDKPLSNLQTGQTVKIRQNAQGVITGLTVESAGAEVLFTRQPDGTFLRAQ